MTTNGGGGGNKGRMEMNVTWYIDRKRERSRRVKVESMTLRRAPNGCLNKPSYDIANKLSNVKDKIPFHIAKSTSGTSL